MKAAFNHKELPFKTENVIANQLKAHGVRYTYETPLLKGKDNRIIKPDFTIRNDDLGITFYWEHLGMLSNEAYKNKWEKKRTWYTQEGIIPMEN